MLCYSNVFNIKDCILIKTKYYLTIFRQLEGMFHWNYISSFALFQVWRFAKNLGEIFPLSFVCLNICDWKRLSSNLLCIVGRLMLFRLLVLTLAKDLHLMERNILSILLFPSSETVRKITNCFIQKKKNVLKKRFVFLNFVFYKRQSSLFVYLFKKADI